MSGILPRLIVQWMATVIGQEQGIDPEIKSGLFSGAFTLAP